MTDSEIRFLRYLRNLERADASHCLHQPLLQADLNASVSPLRQGQIAARAIRRLESRLFRQGVASWLHGQSAPTLPDYRLQNCITPATVVGMGTALQRLVDGYTGHTGLFGATGCGKTTAEVRHADLLLEWGVKLIFLARKEAGRLLFRYPGSLLVRPQQLPVNLVDTIGEPVPFYSEWVPIVARGIGLRSDYVPRFLNVVVRANTSEAAKGRKLSFSRLQKAFQSLGQRGDRRSESIAGALATFNLFLGDTARIEQAPAWEDQYLAIIFDREGAPPAYRACLDGIMQLRFRAQAAQEGYTQHLRRALFYDEAGLEFGREFEAQQSGAGSVSVPKMAISQMRSYGVGIFISGQSYSSMAQDIKDNLNQLFAFRTLSGDDARELALRGQLSDEQRQRLPTLAPGRAFVAAPDLPGGIEVQFDKIELGPYPSEAQIAARVGPMLQQLLQQTVFTPEDPIEPLDLDELLGESPAPTTAVPTTPAEARSTAIALLTDHWAFLRDVAQFESSGVAERFHRLGFGGSKGNRIKEELIALGLLEIIEVRRSAIGRTTKVLRLTPLARTLPDI